MRLTLVHNPEAGETEEEQPSREELIALARDAGYRVRYQDAHDRGLAGALEEPADLVLVAGGDGTVAKVARNLAGRDRPLAIVPLGTANNIAFTLGVHGSARDIVHGLHESVATALDVGRAKAPWGTACFVESAGTGFFGSVLRDASDREARAGTEHATTPVEQAARNLRRKLDAYRPAACHVLADDTNLSGTYLLAEVMNIRSIGPRIILAPDADPGDGLLDLVLLRESDRRAFSEYLADIARGANVAPPFETRRARRVSIVWDAAGGHLDDEPWPAGGMGAQTRGSRSAPTVEVEIVEPAVRVLLPPSNADERAAR